MPLAVWFLEPETSNIGYLDPLGSIHGLCVVILKLFRLRLVASTLRGTKLSDVESPRILE